MTRKKLCHWRPQERALTDCPGNCICLERKFFDREMCEDRYQRAIQAIIADIRALDPPDA